MQHLPDEQQRDVLDEIKAWANVNPVTRPTHRPLTLEESGFTCSCSTISDIVRPNTDLFHLPRLEVENRGGEEFASRLSVWFHR